MYTMPRMYVETMPNFDTPAILTLYYQAGYSAFDVGLILFQNGLKEPSKRTRSKKESKEETIYYHNATCRDYITVTAVITGTCTWSNHSPPNLEKWCCAGSGDLVGSLYTITCFYVVPLSESDPTWPANV